MGKVPVTDHGSLKLGNERTTGDGSGKITLGGANGNREATRG